MMKFLTKTVQKLQNVFIEKDVHKNPETGICTKNSDVSNSDQSTWNSAQKLW